MIAGCLDPFFRQNDRYPALAQKPEGKRKKEKKMTNTPAAP